MGYVKIWRCGNFSYQKNQGEQFSGSKGWVGDEANQVVRVEKKYVINPTMKKTFRSRALRLWYEAKEPVITQLLTYKGAKKDKKGHILPPWHDFNRYRTNLSKNYGLKRYAVALEKGTEGGLYHFHCIFEIPYTRVERFNDAWAAARGQKHSKNAVRDVRKVRNVVKCAQYASKYLSKVEQKKHKYRKFSYSRDLGGQLSDDFKYISLDESANLGDFKRFEAEFYSYGWFMDTGKIIKNYDKLHDWSDKKA